MSKKIGSFMIILYIFMVCIMTYVNISIPRIVELSMIYILITFVVLFETKTINSKDMVVIAVLATIGGVLRVPFAVIPGVQPVTFICAVAGYTLGSINGFMVGAMCALISNFFLGQGPWTLWQMIAWGMCGVFFGALKPIINKKGIILFTIFCGVWGYIYGIILDQWYVIEFIRPITFKSVVTGIALSFPQDTMHCIGNIIFSITLGKNFINILKRYNKRNEIVYLE
ncbi:ECF transporter S component [Haloimpatiens sp. FM7330]|uniref:ECF transporter S component n=1 Tax=Haloimpatiens sp. FM7330 TaxID=3298610 RepID=UPI00362EEB2F